MQRNELVSIIIPCYDVAQYLAACLDSVVSQTYEAIEVLCIDDGSTDQTPQILADYAARHKNIKVIKHDANRGLSAARNSGIAVARGIWVMFVDADDLLPEFAVEQLIQATGQGSEMACGQYSTQWPCHKKALAHVHIEKPTRALHNVLYQHRGYDNSAWAKIYSRTLFEDSDATLDDSAERYMEGIFYEDLEIFPRLCMHANSVAYTTQTVYFYRQTPGSILNTFTHRRLDALLATKLVEEFIARRCPSLLAAAVSRRLSANFNIYGLLAANPDCDWLTTDERSRLMDQCYDYIRANRSKYLFNFSVRLKNRLGILASYLPRPTFTRIMAKHYK